jgi:hypothetical protein
MRRTERAWRPDTPLLCTGRSEYQRPGRPNDGHGWATHIPTCCPDGCLHTYPVTSPALTCGAFSVGRVHFTGNTDNQSSLAPGGAPRQCCRHEARRQRTGSHVVVPDLYGPSSRMLRTTTAAARHQCRSTSGASIALQPGRGGLVRSWRLAPMLRLRWRPFHMMLRMISLRAASRTELAASAGENHRNSRSSLSGQSFR